jgi:lysophospholipase L1-like esterase
MLRTFVVASFVAGSSTVLVSCLPASSVTPGTVKTVMPLGDSITDGYTTPGGYRIRLWNLLVGQDHDPLNFVGSQQNGPIPDQDNEGFSGWRIDMIRAHIDTWMIRYRPNAVLLNIGDNDVLENYQLSTAPARLEELVLRMCKDDPGVKVLVSNLIGGVGSEVPTAAFNAKVPGVVRSVATTGCKVYFVDVHKYVHTATDLADGHHPTPAGYAKMADAWYTVLAPLMARH